MLILAERHIDFFTQRIARQQHPFQLPGIPFRPFIFPTTQRIVTVFYGYQQKKYKVSANTSSRELLSIASKFWREVSAITHYFCDKDGVEYPMDEEVLYFETDELHLCVK